MHHRSDIDGLRAVAVLPVVLFHAGWSYVGGGFVGVDIFFVISGFLITSIIIKEVGDEKFSIVKFYERRIRRIFPALFFMLFTSCVIAALILLPPDFKAFGLSLVAATVFSSNILFWRQSGYFDAPAATKPLLHTWSLSVEEQFYIIFPLLLILIWRRFGGRWGQVLLPLAVFSLLISIWGVGHKAEATFYLLPTRAWELSLGSILAINMLPPLRSPMLRQFCALLGLGLILWGILLFTTQTPFPGAHALPPCLGTALIIYAGQSGTTVVGRVLSARPFVFIGLISYSLYLWHWPLLVFAKYWTIRALGGWETALVLLLAFAAATVSLYFVERPFREKRVLPKRSALFAAAAACMLSTLLFGMAAWSNQGWSSRFPQQVSYLASFSNSINPRRAECFERTWLMRGEPCVYGDAAHPEWALWGDSYGDAIISAMGSLAGEHGRGVLFFGRSACPPLIDVEREGDAAQVCSKHNRETLKAIVGNASIKNVILVGRFAAYVEGPVKLWGIEEPGGPIFITDQTRAVKTEPERKELFKEKIGRTVDALIAANKHVFLLYPIAEAPIQIPEALAKTARKGDDPASFFIPASSFAQRNASVFQAFDSLPSNPRLIRVYPSSQLCDIERCAVYQDGKSLYRDGNHLSLYGADYVFRKLGFASFFANQSGLAGPGAPESVQEQRNAAPLPGAGRGQR